VRVELRRLAEADALAALLTGAERAQADRLVHPAVRARHIVSRALRRRLLADCTGRPPAQLAFEEEQGAKPRLAAAGAWDFNTSHAGDFVAVCAAPFPVGLDLEVFREVPEMDRIVRRYFHRDEAEAWLARPPTSQHADFFTLWCAREAAMKCAGLGLAAGMEITRVDPAILCHHEAPAQVGEFQVGLRKLEAPPGYVMVLGIGL
jgi:4'-phosphopantetheinyl transferase